MSAVLRQQPGEIRLGLQVAVPDVEDNFARAELEQIILRDRRTASRPEKSGATAADAAMKSRLETMPRDRVRWHGLQSTYFPSTRSLSEDP